MISLVHSNSFSEGGGSVVPERLKQSYTIVKLHDQISFLFSFLRSHCRQKIIVFVNSCKQVRFLFEVFRRLKPGW